MIYSGDEIWRLVKEGAMRVIPDLRPENIRPVGLRLHLADSLLIPKPGQTVDLTGQSPEFTVLRGFQDYLLKPGEFVLGSTEERVWTGPGIVGQLDGRSTIARIGLSVHNASAFIDGTIQEPISTVLELVNHGPFHIVLKPGMPVAMMVFHQITGDISPGLFHGQYAGQSQVVGPKLETHPYARGAGDRK